MPRCLRCKDSGGYDPDPTDHPLFHTNYEAAIFSSCRECRGDGWLEPFFDNGPFFPLDELFR